MNKASFLLLILAAFVALLASMMAKPTNGNAMANVNTIVTKQINNTQGILSCSSLSVVGGLLTIGSRTEPRQTMLHFP